MEKLKDPAMLLSMANSIALIGTTAYFYKQIESVRADMVKTSQTLTGVVRKIAEMEKGDQYKGEAIHTLNDQLKHINEQIAELPSFDEFGNTDIDIAEIIAVLEEHNILVDRPSQVSRPRRSGDRRPTDRRIGGRNTVDSDVVERRPVPRTADRNRSDTSRDFDTRRPQSARDSLPARETTRPHPPLKGAAQPQESRSETPGYEEDYDLVGEVRRQQTRA